MVNSTNKSFMLFCKEISKTGGEKIDKKEFMALAEQAYDTYEQRYGSKEWRDLLPFHIIFHNFF
ncbi:hypothetical protein [Lentibacillus amyloliquefaciens]|uniref:hypothetical protein n=1 Tax=Lentibacillus amyloliquefaciens TaxID=1472767 RepID=UPI0012E3B085|nr:hypothetical protein [Lentibacillus amyloliquefaciens]